MCYSVAYLEKKLSKLVERYKNILPPGWESQNIQTKNSTELPVYYFVSGFSHPILNILTEHGLEHLNWGLIPFWVRNDIQAKKIRVGTLNAVGETVFEKPSFRASIRSKRCLLPVSGFFEWREFAGKKHPYFIHKNNKEIFSLGCIYDTWTDSETGEIHKTFSIITTPANPLLAIIHNRKKRMPLIIGMQDEKQWLNPTLSEKQVKDLIKPYSGNLEAYTVSQMLNYSRNDRNIPDAVNPYQYADLPVL